MAILGEVEADDDAADDMFTDAQRDEHDARDNKEAR